MFYAYHIDECNLDFIEISHFLIAPMLPIITFWKRDFQLVFSWETYFPQTSPYVSLPAICVETEHLEWVRLSTVGLEFCNIFIKYRMNLIVVSFSKGVFTWEIARCFFWHLSRLLAKTGDLRVDTYAAKSRPFLVLTFKWNDLKKGSVSTG